MLKRALGTIKENWVLYLSCNGIYYGIVILGMIVTIFMPQLQQDIIGSITDELTTEGNLLNIANEAYMSGSVIRAAVTTFIINLLMGTLLVLTLPSLLFPPLGAVMAAYRAGLWGLMLSPVEPSLRLAMIPHSLTLLLEGQGYILAAFAGLVAFKGLIKPERYNETKRLLGYKEGWKEAAPLYALVVSVLAVAAIYEAASVIWIVSRFS